MNNKVLIGLALSAGLFSSCEENSKKTENTEKIESSAVEVPAMEFINAAHEIVFQSVEKMGNLERLKALKDVQYSYIYQTADGKKDSITERYIFENELSYAKYHIHERSMTKYEGELEQGFDGENFWLYQDGEMAVDQDSWMKMVRFSRKTNFYWFCMFQKLLDPGVNYKMIGEDSLNGNFYNVVEISFKSDQPTDIYRLFINKKTNLCDRFLFTVMDFNKSDPFVMTLDYTEVDGILIPSKRKYTKGDWDGNNLNDNWTLVSWENIEFNNGFTKTDFEAK